MTNLYVKDFPDKSNRPKSDSDEPSEADNHDEGMDEFNESDLIELFKPFGEIASAVVMKDDVGRSRGFGFVCFSRW